MKTFRRELWFNTRRGLIKGVPDAADMPFQICVAELVEDKRRASLRDIEELAQGEPNTWEGYERVI